jgi:hypothetical protein
MTEECVIEDSDCRRDFGGADSSGHLEPLFGYGYSAGCEPLVTLAISPVIGQNATLAERQIKLVISAE